MSTEQYQQVADLISRVRNARFGEMVQHLEQLIDTDIWRDFTTPVGTHFMFNRCEFDYFLAAQEIDPTVVRWAYLKADGIDDLAAKQLRLADITGRGAPPTNGDRRDAETVAREYDADQSGAGARIRAWVRDGAAVVTERTAKAAQDPARRKAMEAGRVATWTEPSRKRWTAEWSDERTAAQAIADKLLKQPELAHEVYKLLRNALYNGKTGKRRSEAQNSQQSSSTELTSRPR